jgi:glycosyltransferase involved in cell wall biosynthesis
VKILLVVPDYPPYNKGGGGTVYKAIAQKLSKRGHTVKLIAGYYEKELKKEIVKVDGGELEHVSLPLMNIFRSQYAFFRAHLPPTLRSIWYLTSIRYNDYDVIHLMAFGHLLIDFVNLMAKRKNKNIIITIHGFPKYVEREGQANIFIKLLYNVYFRTLGKHTINSANTITVPSTFVAKECLKNHISNSKIQTVSNGIDLGLYTPIRSDELENKYIITEDDILLLSIGRVYWFKGFEYAIESIPLLAKKTNRPIKYMIIGQIEDHTYFSVLNRQIERLNLKDSVIFTGFVDQKFKLSALSRANVFLIPSVHETFGIVTLEAMAMGKPIVASHIEGIRDILEHMNTGILVSAAEPERISDAIVTLLDNAELNKKLSSNAKYKVKEYDWERIADRYERIYRSMT